MPIGEDPRTPGGHPVPEAFTFNPKRRAAFLLALAETGTVVGASARVGISKATVYRAAQEDDTFRDSIERARGEWEQSLVAQIAKAGLQGNVIERRGRGGTKRIEEPGDWRALAWLLEHSPSTRERYAGILRQKVEMGGAEDLPPIQHDVKAQIDIGPAMMDRLARVVMVLVESGKMRLPDPNEIEGEFSSDDEPDEPVP